MPKQTKATATEKNQRIDLVVVMLLEGQTRASIHSQMRIKYGLSERNTDYYIREARECIGDAIGEDREYRVGQAIMRLDDLYFQSYEEEDYRTCLHIQNNINRLLGLNEPVRIQTERQRSPVDLSVFSEAELAELVRLNRKIR